MATQNCINLRLPLIVSNGGTGQAILTDHGILAGSGTNAIDVLGVGSTGTLLVGDTGNDAAMDTSSDGNFTFMSAAAGTDRIVTVSNTDNSNAASSATMQLTTGGSSAGDASIKWTITGTNYNSMGIDNSAADALKISNSTSLGTTDSWIMTSAGECTMPLQSASLAYLDTEVTNINGGINVTVVFNNEVFDQNGDYNPATGIFTAPVTGRYKAFFSVSLTDATAQGSCNGFISPVSSNAQFQNNRETFNATIASNGDEVSKLWNGSFDMDAGDTFYVSIFMNSATDLTDIYGGTERRTFMGIYLVC